MLNILKRNNHAETYGHETPHDREPFDVTKMEADIVDVVTTFEPKNRTPEDVAQLTTEAIQQQYEEAVKSLEAMGAIVLARVHDIDEVKAQCMDAIKYINETALMYRQDAERVAAHIAHAHKVTQDVRTICADMQSRVRMPVPTEEALAKVNEAVDKIAGQ